MFSNQWCHKIPQFLTQIFRTLFTFQLIWKNLLKKLYIYIINLKLTKHLVKISETSMKNSQIIHTENWKKHETCFFFHLLHVYIYRYERPRLKYKESYFRGVRIFVYCSVLSLGGNVITRGMSKPDMGSMFQIKN